MDRSNHQDGAILGMGALRTDQAGAISALQELALLIGAPGVATGMAVTVVVGGALTVTVSPGRAYDPTGARVVLAAAAQVVVARPNAGYRRSTIVARHAEVGAGAAVEDIDMRPVGQERIVDAAVLAAVHGPTAATLAAAAIPAVPPGAVLLADIGSDGTISLARRVALPPWQPRLDVVEAGLITLLSVPAAPAAPALTSTSALAITATWAAPSSSTAISAYRMEWRQVGGSWDARHRVEVTARSASMRISPGDRATGVEVRVAAQNIAGWSAAGPVATILSRDIVADAPLAQHSWRAAGTYQWTFPWVSVTRVRITVTGASGGGGGGGGGYPRPRASTGPTRGHAGGAGEGSAAVFGATTIAAAGGGAGDGGGAAPDADTRGADGRDAQPPGGGVGGRGRSGVADESASGASGGDGGDGAAGAVQVLTTDDLSAGDTVVITVGAAGPGGAGGRRGWYSRTSGALISAGRGSNGIDGSVTIEPIT